MSIFKGLFKSRDKPQNSYDSPSYTYFFGRANSGKRVTDRTALQHIAVYACVRVLSEAIAQLPLHVYKYNDKGKERVPNHPLYFLLHDQPNPEMTSFVFRETLMSHLLIYVGDDFYPAIIDRETFLTAYDRIKANTCSRSARRKEPVIYTEFEMDEPTKSFDDPFEQAEYIYSLIGVK